ncbi:MAG: FixH family protein [Desulfovibrio sp.]|jgi:hypothetical protein|nr:FixH family protein [Desulfovibrio sp.]
MIPASKQRLFVLFCLFCWAAAGLPASASAAPAGREISLEKRSPDHVWTLRLPDRPGVVQVSLTVRDAAGRPAQGGSVTGEVWMPEMRMQGYPLELRFEEADGGNYLALVQFGHGGYWRIRALFRDDGGQVVEQSFDFTLAD